MNPNNSTEMDVLMAKNVSGDRIRSFILRTLHVNRFDLVEKAASSMGIRKSQVRRQIDQLVAEGKITWTEGMLTFDEKTHTFNNPISERDREAEVYIERVEPLLSSFPENVQRICYYGFTEMYNNAVDHSEGTSITVHSQISDYSVEFMIEDDGIGIFEKIKKAFGLEDNRQVLAGLAKGGLTTDPERHSGQGIFFTSRAFDYFTIISRKASFSHVMDEEGDWLLESKSDHEGTLVVMAISRESDRSLRSLFDRFTVDKEELTVFKTHAPLRLSSLARGDFVSRSQAKRILARFDKYEEVFLDFEGVDFIGQAFADEIFRVFAGMNPSIELTYINANKQVLSMIRFARNTVPTGPGDAHTGS